MLPREGNEHQGERAQTCSLRLDTPIIFLGTPYFCFVYFFLSRIFPRSWASMQRMSSESDWVRCKGQPKCISIQDRIKRQEGEGSSGTPLWLIVGWLPSLCYHVTWGFTCEDAISALCQLGNLSQDKYTGCQEIETVSGTLWVLGGAHAATQWVLPLTWSSFSPLLSSTPLTPLFPLSLSLLFLSPLYPSQHGQCH